MTWEETSDLGAFISGGKYIQHVHIASRKRRLMPGEDGDADNYVDGFRGLKAIGFDKYVSFECDSKADDRNTAAAGAFAWVPVAQVPNLPRAAEELKDAGFWVYGADMSGTPLYKSDLRGRIALVLGSEGKGISRLLRECCDKAVAIPSKGKVDSLNVSVAAGVLFYEIMRQNDTV